MHSATAMVACSARCKCSRSLFVGPHLLVAWQARSRRESRWGRIGVQALESDLIIRDLHLAILSLTAMSSFSSNTLCKIQTQRRVSFFQVLQVHAARTNETTSKNKRVYTTTASNDSNMRSTLNQPIHLSNSDSCSSDAMVGSDCHWPKWYSSCAGGSSGRLSISW